ncbi:hypothetical protein [Ciceribacter sp. L1K22]|uniref:hypothetical protein n=1 Tax=Ciceribacter sp. L1K22 TaxID=2820275 RepID=UPI001ABE4150|nr:hypothetical protein [Ciceribacter sp. L1K22]MBO3761093.1 hypothetical protein [Ciceribacter sp. L1K22]
MVEYFLEIAGIDEAPWWASVILDSFQILGIGLAGWTLFAWRRIKSLFQSRFSSELVSYCGEYFCYRWSNSSRYQLIEPKVVIYREWSGRFMLKWIRPNESTSRNAYTINKIGREYAARGVDVEDGSPTQILFHASYTKPPSVISGVYMFLNTGHEVVCGPFLMSRRKLTKEQVKEVMPFSAVTSSQAIAADREKVLENSSASACASG